MACDLQMTQHNSVKWKAKTKIYKFKAHEKTYPHCDFVVGFAGSAGEIISAVEFFSNPESFKKIPYIKTLTGLVLTEVGYIFLMSSLDQWLLIDEPFAAIGTGTPFALGAMELGATPKEAVRAAMKRDPFTGLGVKTHRWKQL